MTHSNPIVKDEKKFNDFMTYRSKQGCMTCQQSTKTSLSLNLS